MKGVKGPVVPARQLSAAGPRGLSAEGDVGVLGDEQRVEATLFDRCGEGSRHDPLVGHECRDTEFHLFIELYRENRIDSCFLIGFRTSEVNGHRI
jgi:hypothetical protein